MNAELFHIQINVSDFKSASEFYKDLFKFLNYKIKIKGKDYVCFENGKVDFWIIQTEKKHLNLKYHRKASGLNHLAFKVNSKKQIDDFHKKFLEKRKIKTLYNTPKKFPEYNNNYYAVFFEGPDRLKLEVTCLN